MLSSKLCFAFLCFCLVAVAPGACAGGKVGSAAIPRSKAKDKSLVSKVFGQGIAHRLVREMKMSFCSELEALTLQLTRPNQVPIASKLVDEMVSFLDAEYDNPQLVVSILVKFSRKMAEPNIFSKIKSLLALHKIVEDCGEKSRFAISQSLKSLRAELDEKAGVPFFSTDSIEEMSGSAGTVAEIESVEFAKDYSGYVLDFLELRGEKEKSTGKAVSAPVLAEKADLVMGLLEQADMVESSSTKMKGKLIKQCLECVRMDRSWLIKQLNKIYEMRSSLDDEDLVKEMSSVLTKFDPSFLLDEPASKAKVSLDSPQEGDDESFDELSAVYDDQEVEMEDEFQAAAEEEEEARSDLRSPVKKLSKSTTSSSSSAGSKKKKSKKGGKAKKP